MNDHLKNLAVVMSLGTASMAHAGDTFENPRIPVGEVCEKVSTLIVDGKDLCEKPEQEVLQKVGISGTSIGLAMLLGGVGLVGGRLIREEGKKKLLTNTNRGLIPGDDLVVLTERVEEANRSTEQKKKEIEDFFENKIQFKDEKYAYVLQFQTDAENGSQEVNDVYQIGLIKETGAIFFHRIIPHFEWLDDSKKWHKSKENPGFIGLDNLKGTLEIMKLYKRGPLFSKI